MATDTDVSRSDTAPAASGTDYDSIVIGAGFSGLALLHHLREAGQRTIALDGAEGIGGTWWINNYPGVRTDSEFSYYSFSFSKEVRDEWVWTQRYPAGKEVLAYLNFVADRLDLRKDIRLDAWVSSAIYDEAANMWRVELTSGEVLTSKYLHRGWACSPSPSGRTSPASTPSPASWCMPLTGRVRESTSAASGSDSSGSAHRESRSCRQSRPRSASSSCSSAPPTSSSRPTTIRSPPSSSHMCERPTTRSGSARPITPSASTWCRPSTAPWKSIEEERRRIFESKWNEGGFHFANECFNDLAVNHESSELASEFIRSKIREIVKDPDTAELLSPRTYSFNGKRVPTGFGYYDAYNLPHVTLVDTATTPISAVTEKGMRVGDTEYELDVIIMATGFDAMTGTLTNIDIIGRGGQVLRDKWASGIRSYLGISMNGFPNLLLSLGPQTPYSNLPVPIQLGRAVDRERGRLRREPRNRSPRGDTRVGGVVGRRGRPRRQGDGHVLGREEGEGLVLRRERARQAATNSRSTWAADRSTRRSAARLPPAATR